MSGYNMGPGFNAIPPDGVLRSRLLLLMHRKKLENARAAIADAPEEVPTETPTDAAAPEVPSEASPNATTEVSTEASLKATTEVPTKVPTEVLAKSEHTEDEMSKNGGAKGAAAAAGTALPDITAKGPVTAVTPEKKPTIASQATNSIPSASKAKTAASLENTTVTIPQVTPEASTKITPINTEGIVVWIGKATQLSESLIEALIKAATLPQPELSQPKPVMKLASNFDEWVAKPRTPISGFNKTHPTDQETIIRKMLRPTDQEKETLVACSLDYLAGRRPPQVYPTAEDLPKAPMDEEHLKAYLMAEELTMLRWITLAPEFSAEWNTQVQLEVDIHEAKNVLGHTDFWNASEKLEDAFTNLHKANSLLDAGKWLKIIMEEDCPPSKEWARIWLVWKNQYLSKYFPELKEFYEDAADGQVEEHESEGSDVSTVKQEEAVKTPSVIQEPVASKLSPEEQKAAVEVASAGWPWENCPPQLLLEAPFSLNRFNNPNVGGVLAFPEKKYYKLAEKNQDFKLFTLPREVQSQIFSYLFGPHSNAAALATTCQKALNCMAAVFEHWDLSRLDFNHAETPIPHTEKDKLKYAPGKLIIVSPFRIQGSVTAQQQMTALHQMTFCFDKWANRFETIHLHRVPMLTVEVLNHVVPYMRNLKLLGVYRCPLIHLGHAIPLLEIVGQAHRIETHKAPAKLDFAPRFHVGPKEGSYGSYGITWDDSGLDTRLAIWCIIEKAIKLAKEQGIPESIMSKEFALRPFIEQLCWNVDETIEALFNETYANDPEQLAALLDFPHTAGEKKNLLYGAPFWGERFPCLVCRDETLGIFYSYEENLAQAPNPLNSRRHVQGTCIGCRLNHYLSLETDHFKRVEMDCVGLWLHGYDNVHFSNYDDTERALGPVQREKAIACAEELEEKRQLYKLDSQEPLYGLVERKQREPVQGAYSSPKITDPKEHTGPLIRPKGRFAW